MKTIEKIRELRNEMFPDKVKLEFGCTDILRMLQDNKMDKIFSITDRGDLLWMNKNTNGGYEMHPLGIYFDLSKGDNLANQSKETIEAVGKLLLSKE